MYRVVSCMHSVRMYVGITLYVSMTETQAVLATGIVCPQNFDGTRNV